MPALAPGDKAGDEPGEESVGKVKMETEVGVATFHPRIPTALMVVGELMASVVVMILWSEARYVMVWPDVNWDVHEPTARPGCEPARSYPLTQREHP